ncbi:MAG: sulfite exporter TauE/SafE family protein [Cytophagaceae bacterium]|nr:sulfite exporter TauE/SafE family protein [Cytophagaceae bacterium]MDW8455540.1 sulfite exporter TauE/SafE family protein [Cytophagaceae bacterium]
METLLLIIAGLAGGFIAGLIGIGGGTIYVFVIPLFLHSIGVPHQEIAQYTIANSIASIFVASATANISLIKMKFFFLKPVLIAGGTACLSSLLLLKYLVNTSIYSVKLFNIVLILLLTYMLIFTLLNARKEYKNSVENLSSGKLAFTGLCSGVVASVSGLGGGIIVIPMLNSIFKINIKAAGSVSSGVIMISSAIMTVYNMYDVPESKFHYYSIGYIIFPIVFALSAGVVIASPQGVKLAHKLPSKTISYIYAVILLLIITKKITELA